MAIFGWIMLSLLAAFGMFILVLFIIPFVISETKVMNYKIKKAIEDKKLDVDKRSEARKHRDEIKREKDFELANKKLDAKLYKVDKQIEIHTKKLKLATELKEATKIEKETLNEDNIDISKKIKETEKPKLAIEEIDIEICEKEVKED